MKKYELTDKYEIHMGRKLYQIKALKDFGGVKAGDLGGYIEKEGNLSHDDNAWVFDNAKIYDNAWVFGNTKVYGNAWVYENAKVFGDTRIFGDSDICGNASVYGNARVFGDANIYGNALIAKSTNVLQIGAIGSRSATTTFFRSKDNNIYVSSGCFLGTLDEFTKAVTSKHTGTKHGKVYMTAIELAKLQIEVES